MRIDGEWYNTDATWDDPVGSENVSRRHMLFSDARAEKDGYVDRYSISDNSCVSSKYDGGDLSAVVDSNHMVGDGDHSGCVGLFDLVVILQNKGSCPICADVDADFVLAENDIDALRELILTNTHE